MNRETILAMEPGVELDALVAEKIMVWKIEPGSAFYWTGPERCVRASFHKFSTDIAAAWEVVEKLRTIGFAFGYYADANDDGEPFPIEASFWKPVFYPMTPNVFEGTGDTAPEAICKAALITVTEAKTDEP